MIEDCVENIHMIKKDVSKLLEFITTMNVPCPIPFFLLWENKPKDEIVYKVSINISKVSISLSQLVEF